MDNTKLNTIDINIELNKVCPRQWGRDDSYLKDMRLLEEQFNMIINYANNMRDELEEVKKEIIFLQNKCP